MSEKKSSTGRLDQFPSRSGGATGSDRITPNELKKRLGCGSGEELRWETVIGRCRVRANLLIGFGIVLCLGIFWILLAPATCPKFDTGDTPQLQLGEDSVEVGHDYFMYISR